ncbi:MAG: ATP12 family protein [Pseudomonadota bacterium]
MSEWKMKRFWTETTVAETDAGFTVHLDGRAIRTPGKSRLNVPTRALAEAMCAEWEAQDGEVRPESMPVTKAANSAIDKVTPQFAEVADMLAGYGETDLLCYRAAKPDALQRRQAEAWDPLLDWCRDSYDAPLLQIEGVMYQPQPQASLQRLRARVHQLDAFALTGFHELVTLPGSLVLGLAVYDGHISAEDAWDISRIDERFQQEQWGVDEDAEAAAEAKKAGLLAGWRFCQMVRPSA